MSIYFTSDTHFGHFNIIKYCNRPFSTSEEMDNIMINNWNEVVQPEDEVFHLGDFSLGSNPASYYLDRLNGKINLIVGNHEKSALREKNRFYSINDLLEVSVEKQRIVLCHYAMKVWNKSHHGSWHLYGHSHGTLPDDPNALSLDIGVDCWNYRPVSIYQIRERMAKKDYKPSDHHGKE